MTVEQSGEVVAFEPGARLSITWNGNPRNKADDGEQPRRIETLVEISFLADTDGTRIELVHSGWIPGDPLSEEESASHRDGWCFFMGNLDSVLSEGEDKRIGFHGMVARKD